MTATAQEFIGDLSKFTRVDVDVVEGDEASEAAYMEIVEYIKAGSMLVRDASYEHAQRRNSAERHQT